MTVTDWLLDSDPAIRWQVLRDLVHAPAEVVAAERARVATEGWGARLLALQGEDGQWAGGACFPARSFNWRDENQGQPWTSTLPTLQLLRDFGIDPDTDRVRRAMAAVRDHCRWEHAGQPFFTARSSLASTAGPSPLARTLVKMWTAWSPAYSLSSSRTAGGTARRRMVPSARRSRPRSTSWKDCWRTSARPEARRNPSRRGAGVRSTSSNESCSDARARAKIVNAAWLQFSFPDSLALRRAPCTRLLPLGRRCAGLRAWTKRSICSDPSSSATAGGCWRTRIPARSTSRLRTATVGPVGGTRCGRCVSSGGMGSCTTDNRRL